MSIITRMILNFEYNHTKTTFLRLSNYLVQCYRYGSISANKISNIDSVQTSNYVSEYKMIRSMLQKSVFYQNTLFQPIKASAIVTSEEINKLYTIQWSSKSAEYILNAIKKLTYCHLSGSRFEISLYNDILHELTTKLHKLEDHQIEVLMQCIIALKNVTNQTKIYKTFIKALDKECLIRFFNSNIQKLLLISDAFSQLQEHNSSFLWRALRKLASKCYKLNGKELVQLLFLCQGKTLNMFEIEQRLECCLHELTADEVAIIARGFFLNKRNIKNKRLMPIIMKKVGKSAEIIESFSIASVLKLIRYSNCQHCLDKFQYLLISLRGEIPRLPLKCLTHITQAFGALHVYDKILTDNILERVKTQLAIARVKDIERILYGISSVTPFTTYYTDFCRTLVNEVLTSYTTYRSTEIETFPISLVRILQFSTIRNIYVPELIQYAFNPKFVQNTYQNNLKLMSNEYLLLHCCVKIDLPHYKGPLLEKEMYAHLIKNFIFDDDVRGKDNTLKLKTEIIHICKNKLGINVCVDYILPYCSLKEMVIGIDKDNNPVDIEPILSAIPMGSIKHVTEAKSKGIKLKILLILSANVTVIGHNGYIGFVYRKHRHLKAIGYTPIPFFEQDWNSFSQEQEKENYLRRLIYEETNLDLN